jgi:hypothetical protein
MIAEIRAGKMTLSHASKILGIFITPARAGNRDHPNRGLGVIRPGF